MTSPQRDDTPVGAIRPIARGEIAEVDDLVDFTGGPIARARRRRRLIRAARRTVLAVFALVIGYYGVTLAQVYRTGRSDQARPVDAIVVLGAAQYDGRPSPQLAARLDHVVGLYGADLAPIVVVTGGSQPGDRFTEAEASARYLAERGIPSGAVVLEPAGHTTFESLRATAAMLADRGLHAVLVVTDPYHSLRSRLIAESFGLEAYVSPTPTSVVRGGASLRRHLLEAAGVAVGRIIGFDHL